jgi:hypothetical protein
MILSGAPALLLGYVLIGMLSLLLGGLWFRRWGQGSHFNQSLRGFGLGMILPISHEKVVSRYRDICKGDIPVGASISFLISVQTVGIVALCLSLPLLGWSLTALRLIGSILIICSLIGIFNWWIKRQTSHVSAQTGDIRDVNAQGEAWAGAEFYGDNARKLGRFAEISAIKVVDATAPMIMMGLLVAALVQPALFAPWLKSLPFGADVLLAVILGLLLHGCAAGITLLAVALIVGGASPGAALAFLMVSPIIHVSSYLAISQICGRGLSRLFVLVVLVLALGMGYVTNLLLPISGVVSSGSTPVGMMQIVSWCCVVIIGLLYLAAFIRKGPRFFLAPTFAHLERESPDHQFVR